MGFKLFEVLRTFKPYLLLTESALRKKAVLRTVTFSATYLFILKRARDQRYQIATTVFLDFLDFFLAARLLDC